MFLDSEGILVDHFHVDNWCINIHVGFLHAFWAALRVALSHRFLHIIVHAPNRRFSSSLIDPDKAKKMSQVTICNILDCMNLFHCVSILG